MEVKLDRVSNPPISSIRLGNLDAISQANCWLQRDLRMKTFGAVIGFLVDFYRAGVKSYHPTYRDKALEIFETLCTSLRNLDDIDREILVLMGARPFFETIFDNYGHFQTRSDQCQRLVHHHAYLNSRYSSHDEQPLPNPRVVPNAGMTTVDPSHLQLPNPNPRPHLAYAIDPSLSNPLARTMSVGPPSRSFDDWMTPHRPRGRMSNPPSTGRRLASGFGSMKLSDSPLKPIGETSPISHLKPITPKVTPKVSSGFIAVGPMTETDIFSPDAGLKEMETMLTFTTPTTSPNDRGTKPSPSTTKSSPESPTQPLTVRQIARSKILKRQGKSDSLIEALNKRDAPKLPLTHERLYVPLAGAFVPDLSARFAQMRKELEMKDVETPALPVASLSPPPGRGGTEESGPSEEMDHQPSPCGTEAEVERCSSDADLEFPLTDVKVAGVHKMDESQDLEHEEQAMDHQASPSASESDPEPSGPIATFLFPSLNAKQCGTDTQPSADPFGGVAMSRQVSSASTQAEVEPSSPVASFRFPTSTATVRGNNSLTETIAEWTRNDFTANDDGFTILHFSLDTSFGMELQHNPRGTRLALVAAWISAPSTYEWPMIQYRINKAKKAETKLLGEPSLTSGESVVNLTSAALPGENVITLEIDPDGDDAMKYVKMEIRVVRRRKRGQSEVADEEIEEGEVTPCPSPTKRTRI